MAWIVLVSVLALLQYFVFSALVGQARGRYGVRAPAISGHEMFERHFRVQYNTLEQLMLFLPALWLAAGHGLMGVRMVALVGAVYLVGRVIYALSYVRDPKSRGLGFVLTLLPSVVFLVDAAAGAIKQLL